MAVESGINEIPKKQKLEDVLPTSNREIKRLTDYIKNAEPNDQFNMDARTLKGLLNRIKEAEKK